MLSDCHKSGSDTTTDFETPLSEVIVTSVLHADEDSAFIHKPFFVGRDPDDINDEIPISFVNGCLGDLVEARRRWQITKEWRKKNDVDNILSKPQPHFETIKRLYPHGVHRCSDSGNWIYIERPGYGKLDEIFAAGITMEDVERHYTFITEYLWRVVDPSHQGQLISIFDVENFALTDLAGDRLKMLRRCSALVGAHYPEKSSKIYIIHTPWYANAAWNIVSPFLDARTMKKVGLLSEDFDQSTKQAGGNFIKTLVKHCDISKIPPDIGGCDTAKLGESPVEIDMLTLVRKLNSR